MPKVSKHVDFLQRIAELEDAVAALRRTGSIREELPFYASSVHGLVYEDNAAWTTIWETTMAPRAATLQLGLVLVGDQVSATNTGGDWQVLLNTDVVGSGTVLPNFTVIRPSLVLDLTPYRAEDDLTVAFQVRRTSGATTGGKWGAGGSIGGSLRYARLL